MMRVLGGWTLLRSPLAPSVPLEGSETVEGLRTLERLRAASLLHTTDTRGSNARQEDPRQSRRRRYQRFKGPFLEQMTTDDVKKDPRSWKQFAGIHDTANTSTNSYNIPATLDVMCERIEENTCYYLTNYLRVAVIVIMLTMYLRPKAVLGVAAIALSAYINLPRAFATATDPNAAQQRRLEEDTTDQMRRGALAVGTWITVAYTKCMPVLLLGIVLALGVIIMHATARQAPSEARHRGRTPLGYSLWQVLGRQPVAAGQDPRLLGKQIWHEMSRAIVWRARQTGRWSTYYALTAWDAIRRPFMRTNQPIGGGWR